MSSDGGRDIEAALHDSLEVAAGRELGRREAGRFDQISAFGLAGVFAAAAVLAAVAGGVWSWRVGGEFALIGLLSWAAYQIEFESALGSCVPTEPVLVLALFVLPLRIVPLMVLAVLMVVALTTQAPGRIRLRTVAVRLIGGWHCLGPVVVLLAAHVHHPRLREFPVYLLALGAQFVCDGTSAGLRCLGTRTPPGELVQPLAFTFAVDALLAPVGLAAAIAGTGHLGAVPPIAALVALIGLLSRDRRQHVESSVALGEAVVAARGEARVDALTGLANRRAWEEAVSAAERQLEARPAGSSLVGIVLADLDGLKDTNDTLGHAAGDELIRALANLLRAAAPSGSIVARVGGDEFAILVAGTQETCDLDAVITSIRQDLANLHPIGGCRLSASLGRASCPPEASLQQAYRTADKAVFVDKAERRVERRRSAS